MSREDDFQDRRKHLANLSEEELENKFWELAEKVVNPIVELARKNTSPSIERSVLLRMGFSSVEAKSIVDGAIDRGIIGKGAGHIVYKLAKEKNMTIREAGLKLGEGQMWDDVATLFKGGAN
ncbi:ornithine aminomutase subunit alpha [Tissierella sp.]|uniref:ornithine aminomutase subunit alpha n=1 Tax=Tissierella sp. TaxID=41274 RepID=UPI00285CBAF2|nr:ornithine aminomutase subunit alpha [Tissierella sp.]MDR7857206.1 ornithine aminomutase subunit alpha [Tissierella sp.]